MLTIRAELTDTYGGEANYSWVRRRTLEMPDNASNLAIVRRAKRALGISGVRCRVDHYNGDTWEIRPYGWAAFAFITVDY